MSGKRLRIRFVEINGFIKIFYIIGHLELFGIGWYEENYNLIKYLSSEKRVIRDSINHIFPRTRIDSYNSLPIEKTLTFHNVIILIKSVVYVNENIYYYNIFLEKGLYKGKSNLQYF